MTELSPQVEAIWNTYIEGYSEALCTPVEQFDTSVNCHSRKILASVLRELVNQLQYQSFHHTEGYYQLDARDILDVAAELERI